MRNKPWIDREPAGWIDPSDYGPENPMPKENAMKIVEVNGDTFRKEYLGTGFTPGTSVTILDVACGETKPSIRVDDVLYARTGIAIEALNDGAWKIVVTYRRKSPLPLENRHA